MRVEFVWCHSETKMPWRFNYVYRRNLRILIDVLPASDSNKQTYAKFVQDNMMSMIQHARTPLGEYGAYWQGPVGKCLKILLQRTQRLSMLLPVHAVSRHSVRVVQFRPAMC